MSRPTCGTYFSGFGLADVGLLSAGFRPVFAVEHDAAIADVYRWNLGDHVIVGDVAAINPADLPYVDLFWASPPCQAHSVARSKSLAPRLDADAGLAVIAYIRHHTPRVVMIENVEGYARADSFKQIVQALSDLGYFVDVQVLNAADFGVPQTRRRLILRACRDQLVPMLPPPVPWVGWYAAIADLVDELPESKFAPWQLARLPEELSVSAIFNNQASDDHKSGTYGVTTRTAHEPSVCVTNSFTPRAFIVHPTDQRSVTVRVGDDPVFTITAGSYDQSRPCSWKPRAFIVDGKPANYAGDLQIIHEDEPTNTITASQPRHPYRAFVGHPTEMRNTPTAFADQPIWTQTVGTAAKGVTRAWLDQGRVVSMTPRALARFQTLPDWFELPTSKALACKGIGNGVPCLLAERLAEAFV